MRPSFFLLLALCAGPVLLQGVTFPLESVTAEGSTIPQPVILEIAGLRLAAPIDKAGIEQACRKLQDSGLFASISFRYAPGRKGGYALTLSLADQAPLASAVIDVPGADDQEAWRWLAAKFPRFDHKAPQADAAQKYLAGQLEQHLASYMRGQHLTVRIETDLKTRRLTLSFQPEVLPRIRSVSFTGNRAIASADLMSVLRPLVANEEYTDRKFTSLMEMNLRPVYEQRGLYRVRFAPGSPQWTDAGVSMSVAITEGEPFQLGKVDLVGEDLPVDRMLAAAKLPNGNVADWKKIQAGIWEMEKVVKRAGFFEASITPDRNYDDDAHTLNLRIRVAKGPLYHFGEVRMTGLSPDLQEQALSLWRPKPGDPYDYAYTNEFIEAFSDAVTSRSFPRHNAIVQKGAGDHVMDINLVFTTR